MNDALVSIVIPTYNRENIIQRAIKSALQQTHENIEVIIVDDGSEDNTEEKIKELDAENLRYIKQSNKGANAARNRGIQEANGEFISFLDSDDELLPEYVARTLSEFDKSDDQIGGVFTAYERVNCGTVVEMITPSANKVTLNQLKVANVIGGLSCTTFRANTLNSVGGFDEELVSSQDYDLYLRILRRYTMRGVSEPLVRIHLDDNRISEDIDRKIRGHKQIVKKHGDMLSRKRISHQHYVRGLLYGEKGYMKLAATEFKTAVVTNPRNPLYTLHYVLCLFGGDIYSRAMGLKNRIRWFLRT